MEQHSQNYAIYKEYQERSAFTQKSFRKKNAAAIDAFEEADKSLAEHPLTFFPSNEPIIFEVAARKALLIERCFHGNALLQSV